MAPLSQQLKPETLQKLGNFKIMAKYAVNGLLAGLHKSLSKGAGGDFIQYRQYSFGDDLRNTDWKLYARLDRLYQKESSNDTNMRCAIIVDASASMAYTGTESALSKYRYALLLAACLAGISVSQGDRTAVFPCAAVQHSPVFAGSFEYIPIMTDTLDTIVPSGEAMPYAALESAADFLSGTGGTAFVISDFIGWDIQANIRNFAPGGRNIHLFHILDMDELNMPFNGTIDFRDAESGNSIISAPAAAREEYTEKMENWLTETREAALNCGAGYKFGTSSSSLLDFFG